MKRKGYPTSVATVRVINPVAEVNIASLPLADGAASEGTLTKIKDYYKKRFDYDESGNIIYIGWAEPGTAGETAGWAIKKCTYAGANLTGVDWADGNHNFDNIWDNRASLNYS